MQDRADRVADEIYFGYRHPETREPSAPNYKQGLAHASLAEEVFFGGAAGPGKSEWIIVDAVKTALQHPRVEVAIFRSTHMDLERSLVPRWHELVDPRLGRFNAGKMRGELRNGSLVWFCYCARDSDVYKYQSAQWVGLFNDEASHQTGFQLNYLRSRVRSPRPGIRLRHGLASNPGHRGHLYLRKRYVRPAAEELGDRPALQPMEIWRPLPPKERPWVVPKTRQFIPALLADNPWMTLANPQYLSELYLQHGAIALQLAEGDWDASDTAILSEWRETKAIQATDAELLALGLTVGQVIPWHVIPKHDWRPPVGAKIYASVDYGYGAPWAFHIHAMLPGGHARTFFEIYKSGVRDEDQARAIRGAFERLTCADGSPLPLPEAIVYDRQMDNSREEHGVQESISDVYRKELGPKLGALMVAGKTSRGVRVNRVQRWKNALATAADGLPHWTVTTACKHAIETLPAVNKDELDEEVEDPDSENHCYEGIGRFLEFRPFAPAPPKHDDLAQLDAVSRRHHEERRDEERKGRSRGIAKGIAGR